MLWIVFAMLVIMALAASVVLYVAFPHRGVQVPHAPWLGDAMISTVKAFPTVPPESDQPGR